MRFNGKLEWDRSTRQILAERNLQSGGAVQQYIDNKVLQLNEAYLPFQTGDLRNAGIRGTVPGRGEVVYNGPKAQFLYYGKVMVGVFSRSAWAKKGERKEVIGKDLTYHGAPQRGAFWFERMKANHKQEILEGAKKISGSK